MDRLSINLLENYIKYHENGGEFPYIKDSLEFSSYNIAKQLLDTMRENDRLKEENEQLLKRCELVKILDDNNYKNKFGNIISITKAAWGCKTCGNDVRKGCDCSAK